MQYYSNPTLKDVMTEIEALQKQVEALRGESPHGLFNKETFVEALGWLSLKQDIAEIKEQLASIIHKENGLTTSSPCATRAYSKKGEVSTHAKMYHKRIGFYNCKSEKSGCRV